MENTVKEQIDKIAREAARQLRELAHPSMQQRCRNRVKRALGRPGYSGDLIFWPAGLLMLGLLEAGELQVIEDYLTEWTGKGMPVLNPDDALTGVVLQRLYQATGKEVYREGAEKILSYLEHCRKDATGSIVYGQRSQNSWIYADGVGQTAMFYAQMGELEKAGRELRNFAAYGMDEASNLPYHGYDAKSGSCYGIIGWGRAVGWLMLGLSSYQAAGKLQSADQTSAAGSAEKGTGNVGQRTTAQKERTACEQDQSVRSMCGTLVSSVMKRRREDGLFSWQLDCRKGPLDTSASGMICYSMLKGGFLQEVSGDSDDLDRTAEDSCSCGTYGICDHGDIYDEFAEALLAQVDTEGRVLQSSAECIDFAQYRQQYGCNPWGQGAVLAYLAAWQR